MKKVQQYRKLAHDSFDRLWILKFMTRWQAYKLLKEHFGEWVHMSQADITTCKKVIRFSDTQYKKLMKAKTEGKPA